MLRESDSYMKINELSNLFLEYKIYPNKLYSQNSPVKVFQNLYPDNYYAIDITEFLDLHRYEPIRRGADLPWWGKNYFDNNNTSSVMIISQDSLSKDAGSVAFWANLYDVVHSQGEFTKYISLLNDKKLFAYNSWERVLSTIKDWNICIENCYITDAAKVYKEGSSKDFDMAASKKLLVSEIELCKPDLIVLLGNPPLRLLMPEIQYSNIIENGEYLEYLGIKTVVSPFITGMGLTQKNYKYRLELASKLIKDIII